MNFIDEKITQFIFQLIPHNSFFDSFFSFFSLQGNSLFIWVFIITAIIVIEEIFRPGIQKTDLNLIFYFLISFSVTVSVVNFILKPIFHRPRPNSLISKIYDLRSKSCPSDFSFPSSHAATAFASAVIIASFDKKRKWFYYGVAFLISLSRIYLGCHYFFDVVTGAIIGYLISRIILNLDYFKSSPEHAHTTGKTNRP